jgi:tRNA A37 methylthiotransferase MiaB
VTRYSRRPFTPLSREGDFPDHIKKERSRAMNGVAGEVYAAANAPWIGRTVPFTVTERLRKGSVMARSPEYTGIVLCEDLPVGFCGEAILKADRRYFFLGERIRRS